MTAVSYFFLVLVGLVVGSFLSMLTYRLPRKLPLTGRSFCDGCKRQITWLENIPLFAYLVTRRCKTCHQPISARYPIIEASTAAIFVLLVFSPYLLAVSLILLSLTIIDYEHQILPDKLIYLLGFALLGSVFLAPSPLLYSHLLWGYLAFLFFLAIYLVTKGRGMGFGDVKLVFVLGTFLGFPGTVVWVFLSFLLGAAVGAVLLLLKKAKLGGKVPFGPFLILGFVAAYLWQEAITYWYSHFLQ